MLAPERLWLLALLPLLALTYVVFQRWRRPPAVRFSNLGLLRGVTSGRAAWRRHVPPVLMAVALGALIVGFAKPTAAVRVPKEAATVILVIDTSASMDARDVSPSRLDAAIEAAGAFVEGLPPQHKVGLVSFDRQARVLAAPTTNHGAVRDAIDSLSLGPGTAAGEALYAALGAILPPDAEDGGDDGAAAATDGAAIVLLSDGVTTVGRPVTSAALAAAQAGIPVSTIAFGTNDGVVEVQGVPVRVPADPDTMAEVAEITAGKFFEAGSDEELKSVYDDIGTRVGYETQQQEVSGSVLATATATLGLALGLAALWNGRLA
jgi:Ca-activated chloride channel family protein